MAGKKGFSSGPKYSAGWWFGKNSWWAQSGYKESLTGNSNGEEKGFFQSLVDGFGINVTHDIPDNQKLLVYGVIGLVVYQVFIK